MTLGRHGLFLNNSMDDNVRLGFQVADHIDQKAPTAAAWLSEMLEFMKLRFPGSRGHAARRRRRGSARPVSPATIGALRQQRQMHRGDVHASGWRAARRRMRPSAVSNMTMPDERQGDDSRLDQPDPANHPAVGTR